MDPDSDLDHSQNLIISSFYLFRHILKISSKSVHKFLSYLVHKRTNSQTNPGENITSLVEVTITAHGEQRTPPRPNTFNITYECNDKKICQKIAGSRRRFRSPPKLYHLFLMPLSTFVKISSKSIHNFRIVLHTKTCHQ